VFGVEVDHRQLDLGAAVSGSAVLHPQLKGGRCRPTGMGSCGLSPLCAITCLTRCSPESAHTFAAVRCQPDRPVPIPACTPSGIKPSANYYIGVSDVQVESSHESSENRRNIAPCKLVVSYD
jgi:hypothetical protein